MKQLAEKYNVPENTILTWKGRDEMCDCSSRPHTIYYSLSEIEQEIIKSVRKSTWLPLDDLLEVASNSIHRHHAVPPTGYCAMQA